MIQLIIYGIIALGFIGAVFGFIHAHDTGVANKQKAADMIVVNQKQAALTVCGGDRDLATGANELLAKRITDILKEDAGRDKAVVEGGRRRDAAQRVKDEQLNRAKGKLAQYDVDAAASQARLGHPLPPGETCEDYVVRNMARVRELNAIELRDRPPAVPDSHQGDPGRPNQNPSVDKMRIGR